MSTEKSKTNTLAITTAIIAGLVTISVALIQFHPWSIPENLPSNHIPENNLIKTFIAGTVVDQYTNENISFAKIEIVGRTESYITESNGNFKINFRDQNLPETFRLRVTKLGYKLFDKTVKPSVDDLVIALSPANELKEIKYKNRPYTASEKRNIKYFKVVGFGREKIIKIIEKKNTNLRYHISAKNVLKISFSGYIENCPDCKFDGGYIVIKVNDNVCYEFQEFKIPRLYEENKKISIDEYIKENIEKYASLESEKISSVIIENCLKK